MDILFLIIAIVTMVLLLLLLIKKKLLFFHQNSIDADAIILSIQLTGVSLKNEVQAIIQLQVQPERGKSFVSDIKEMLTTGEYTLVHPGNKIRVRYNPGNYREIIILKDNANVLPGEG
ncbi:MAG: hypothetical protein ABIS69_12270 [Sediminibacterium sp.]